MHERYPFSPVIHARVPQGNCTIIFVENNTNQQIIIENKNCEEII